VGNPVVLHPGDFPVTPLAKGQSLLKSHKIRQGSPIEAALPGGSWTIALKPVGGTSWCSDYSTNKPGEEVLLGLRESLSNASEESDLNGTQRTRLNASQADPSITLTQDHAQAGYLGSARRRRTHKHVPPPGPVRCNTHKTIHGFQKFTLKDLGHGLFALKGGGLHKWCTDSPKGLVCASPKIGPGEKFKLISQKGKFSIMSMKTKRLLTNDSQGKFVGCYKDNGGGKRDLPVAKGQQNSTTTCMEACAGYEYYGLEAKNQCFCGNKYGSQGKAKGCHCKPPPPKPPPPPPPHGGLGSLYKLNTGGKGL